MKKECLFFGIGLVGAVAVSTLALVLYKVYQDVSIEGEIDIESETD